MEKKTQRHNRRNENSVVDPVYDEIEYYPVISDFCRNQITYCIEWNEKNASSHNRMCNISTENCQCQEQIE